MGLREEKSQEQPGTTEVFWSHEEMAPKGRGQPVKKRGMAVEMRDTGASFLVVDA